MSQGATEGSVPSKQGSKSSKRKTQNPRNRASKSGKDNDPKNNSEEGYLKSSCITGRRSKQSPSGQDSNTKTDISKKKELGEFLMYKNYLKESRSWQSSKWISDYHTENQSNRKEENYKLQGKQKLSKEINGFITYMVHSSTVDF